MVEKASSVVLNFKMDGQVQYAETLKQINTVMNTAAKEYKNHIAAMGKEGSATDKLRAEKKKLEIQMEGAQKRTKMLADEFEEMSNDTNTTTEQLDKMYGKLLDSERAEISLQKSLDRVNDGLSDQAQEAREAQESLTSLKDENKLLEAEQKSLTSSFKLQKAELGDNASEAEKAELAQKQLAAQMELTDRVVGNLEQQLDASKRAYGENSVEVMQLETKLNEARTGIKKFEDSLQGIDEGSQAAGDAMEEMSGKMDAQNLFDTADALQGISDKLIELGKYSFDSALTFGDSQTYLQANMGLTEDKASELNSVVKDVFKNGVVESVEEATEAVTLVKSAFEDLNNVELENITNQITSISKRTGTDVQENVRATDQLMNAMGMTAEEALDLIASGYQRNLNVAGDFTDTINEYAPLFAEAGYSGQEMLSLLSAGMENGALNTDKVADAIKEMQVRLGDGSFKDNLDKFSSGTKDAFKRWKEGEYTVEDVTNSIAEDLKKMDPVKQQAALTVLGTQFEDLGIKGSLSLLEINDSFKEVNGSADQMAEKNPTEKLQAGLRELQDILAPVGERLVDFAIDTLPKIISAVEGLYTWFTNLAEPIQTFITAFGGLTGVAIILSPIIATIVAGFMAFGSTMAIVIGVVVAVIGVISGIIAIFQSWGSITDWFAEKYNQFTTWLSKATGRMKESVVGKFNEMKDGAVGKFNELKSKGSEIIQGFKDSALNKASELKTSFVNKASELKNEAIEKFNSFKESAKEIFNNLKDDIMEPINKAKDSMNTAIEKMKGFLDFEWSLPKLKAPKVSVDMKKNSWGIPYPSFDIKWNAKGGIFTQPTIFGASGGKLQGIGEAGPEAALPLNEQTLGAIGKGIADTMGRGSAVEIHNHFGQVNTNSPSELLKLDRRIKRSADFGLLGKGGVPE